MDVSAFVRHIRHLSWYRDQIVHLEDIPSRTRSAGTLDQPLSPPLQRSRESHGLEPLYSHQADAIDALRRGENVIVSRPAASGKSQCYHVPVL